MARVRGLAAERRARQAIGKTGCAAALTPKRCRPRRPATPHLQCHCPDAAPAKAPIARQRPLRGRLAAASGPAIQLVHTGRLRPRNRASSSVCRSCWGRRNATASVVSTARQGTSRGVRWCNVRWTAGGRLIMAPRNRSALTQPPPHSHSYRPRITPAGSAMSHSWITTAIRSRPKRYELHRVVAERDELRIMPESIGDRPAFRVVMHHVPVMADGSLDRVAEQINEASVGVEGGDPFHHPRCQWQLRVAGGLVKDRRAPPGLNSSRYCSSRRHNPSCHISGWIRLRSRGSTNSSVRRARTSRCPDAPSEASADNACQLHRADQEQIGPATRH
jgi:hypothetical protein